MSSEPPPGRASSEVLAVSQERWAEAQKWENSYWVNGNSHNSILRIARKFIGALRRDPSLFWKYLRYGDFYCGDDHNYWWQKQFDNYSALPTRFERAIEVGCGPYSNIRLISHGRSVGEIVCADPLIRTYAQFKKTWIAEGIRKKTITPSESSMESISYADSSFDLAVCINVLDHVRDASQCLRELLRVTRAGGYIVLAQDLTNEEDLSFTENRDDVGHPIKIEHGTLDDVLGPRTKPILRKVMAREKGRNPKYHYGTYIFIGQRT